MHFAPIGFNFNDQRRYLRHSFRVRRIGELAAELKAELENLRRENAVLKKGTSLGIRLKVSEKGAVSVYGMDRFPVTLYKEQWLKLLDMSDNIGASIAANEGRLKALRTDRSQRLNFHNRIPAASAYLRQFAQRAPVPRKCVPMVRICNRSSAKTQSLPCG
jgi:hypothetical protein